ncbi:hypothetical protein CDV31_007425 [Fusarium ambrosium]|uniref:Heterokaryon incompatibility domain-containing protein n=1 Tax=Fusarium ambrosium TaxID=131363 RepID=A0A428U6Q4_9HYPO|nr:hypothetical protein CDV31_007425 [Fusarium ambrosium]
MTRWHFPSCQSPIVWVGEDSVPACKACGASAHEQLQQLTEHPSNPAPPLPPDEKPGQLNLYWPSTVPYTREQTAVLAGEIHDYLQISNTPPRTQESLIHGRTLAEDEFRLICLTAEENGLPADVIHLSLETYNFDNFPDYEAVSYTWGGEDGDGTLRHPIYIGDHWDILLQTRNCCAMLRYLRPSRGIRMVWVDAICINQEDMQERGDQVAKMGQLYTGCSQVFLWLGDDIAFRKPGVYPPRLPLHELENLEELQLPSRKERVNIRSLFERRYFSRVWIIQELILPPRIAIPIGDKIFWVDPFTATHFERLPSRDWLWEQTGAPWFQHVTRGSVLMENLSGLVTLTWKSQSSDKRDKVYGVMGLSMKEGIQIRPDYGISLQHLLIGFFAHCIIRGGTPQLLLKAVGASAEVGMPSWMPPWKGDAWERLFSSNNEENPPWENVENILVEEKSRLQYLLDHLSLEEDEKKYRLVRFLPRSLCKKQNKLTKTVFDRRPWHQDATVDADTGAMSLYLTRLMSIKNRPVRADFPLEGWYKMGCPERYDDRLARLYHQRPGFNYNRARISNVVEYIYFMSRSHLDEVVEAGDDIFLLDTDVRAPIYLILRKTDNPGEFRLIATCSHLAFFFVGSYVDIVPSWEALSLGDLQASLYADLEGLHDLCNYEDYEGHYEEYASSEVWSDSSDSSRSYKSFDDFQGMLRRFLFPGRRAQLTTQEMLSLLLGIVKDDHEQKLKSWKSFQERYLELIDPKFQPRVCGLFCELSLDVKDKEEIGNLLDRRNYHSRKWIKELPAKDDAGRVVLRRDMWNIRKEVSNMIYDLGLVDSLVDRLEDADVGERIMAGPVEEDHFRGGTHFGLNAVFQKFGLDGSTFRVRIV